MVLLSVAARLPQTDDSPLRLFCATTSFDHPNLPAKPEYNRMALGVSGFFAVRPFHELMMQATAYTF